uniref:Uncharacterized protein n=1 Tax=Schistocephalus solidus TaxID=70667 RepID=A0A0X3NSQ0_SCHSO
MGRSPTSQPFTIIYAYFEPCCGARDGNNDGFCYQNQEGLYVITSSATRPVAGQLNILIEKIPATVHCHIKRMDWKGELFVQSAPQNCSGQDVNRLQTKHCYIDHPKLTRSGDFNQGRLHKNL